MGIQFHYLLVMYIFNFTQELLMLLFCSSNSSKKQTKRIGYMTKWFFFLLFPFSGKSNGCGHENRNQNQMGVDSRNGDKKELEEQTEAWRSGSSEKEWRWKRTNDCRDSNFRNRKLTGEGRRGCYWQGQWWLDAKSRPEEDRSRYGGGMVPAMSPPAVENTRSVVLVDAQETGVHLVHTLMACADAIQQENSRRGWEEEGMTCRCNPVRRKGNEKKMKTGVKLSFHA